MHMLEKPGTEEEDISGLRVVSVIPMILLLRSLSLRVFRYCISLHCVSIPLSQYLEGGKAFFSLGHTLDHTAFVPQGMENNAKGNNINKRIWYNKTHQYGSWRKVHSFSFYLSFLFSELSE